MEINDVRIGQFLTKLRTNDGAIPNLFNATLLLEQWNDAFDDDKSIESFMSEYKSFMSEFLGKEYIKSEIIADGCVWLDPYMFRQFLCYLSPELAMTEFPKP